VTLPIVVRSAGYSLWRRGHYYARREAKFLGIEIVTSGNAEFTQAGERYIVETGGVFVKHRGLAHRYRTGPAGFLCKRFVSLTGRGLAAIEETTGLSRIDVIYPDRPAAVTALLRRIVCELRTDARRAMRPVSALSYELLTILVEGARATGAGVVQDAMDFLEGHLALRTSNRALARSIGLSIPHTTALFRSEVGETPMQYLMRRRMDTARQLLEGTDMPVKRIAASVGFADQLYFSRQFKRHTGVSPVAYRKERQDW
jgi:AraC-like DNA-binding protein